MFRALQVIDDLEDDLAAAAAARPVGASRGHRPAAPTLAGPTTAPPWATIAFAPSSIAPGSRAVALSSTLSWTSASSPMAMPCAAPRPARSWANGAT